MSTSRATQMASKLALTLISLGVGYYLGKHASANNAPVNIGPPAETADALEEDEEEVEDIADGDLAAITAGLLEPCKMSLVIRSDLKMTPGKVAAQCGHATLACYKALVKLNPKLVRHWEQTGQAKIALKATSEDQLLELEAIAKSLNLCARSIQDAGHTQVDPGTRTVLAIGPAPARLVDEVTRKLRLF
ncbi:peptidyl-tRNA hydrolase PTH2-domain-containing protein [Crucibulum laeve]|uniref:peptidyl-tRNA hydrolase n=1 Tax=Crucibulum laeve TaxID=68775 RepID=A0A5C3M7D5_9AGAR|nr:peptidyl-tRNA hydrolase PTH2-domain-containing protein [Crucibulum laeve]